MTRNYNYEGLSETIQVREAHQFDLGDLTKYLKSKIEGVVGSLQVLQLRYQRYLISSNAFQHSGSQVRWCDRR